MKIVKIDESNIDSEHICCAIGNDKTNKNRAETKKNWMKSQFENGLIFKRLDDRGKIFIEYMPIEKAWKPIFGKNFMMINCLWVSGKFKKQGIATKLLDEVIQDAKKQKMDGVAVVSSTKVKPFLTDKRFFLHHGFEVIDTSEPYFELLALKFKKNAENPCFMEKSQKNNLNKSGFTFVYSNQCPFMEEYVYILSEISEKENISSKIIKLSNFEEAQNLGSPFGTLGIYYNGEFVTHELLSEKKFNKLLTELN
jgi:predicted GNAT family acetyltransferase